jgi:hypothetical protein
MTKLARAFVPSDALKRKASLKLTEVSKVLSSSHSADIGPARKLQQRVAGRLSTPSEDKWSPRKTLAIVLVTCGGFWVVAGLLVHAIL